VVLLGGTAGAGAAERAAPPVLQVGPVLAQGGVAWGEQAAGALDIRLARPGHASVVLYRHADAQLTEIAGSPSLVAFRFEETSCGSVGMSCGSSRHLVSVGPGGRVSHISDTPSCDGGGWLVFPGMPDSLDTAGRRVTSSETRASCAGSTPKFHRRVFVRDPSGTRVLVDRSQPTPDQWTGDVRLAGRFLAWSTDRGGTVVVYDLAAGKVAYRARLLDRQGLGNVTFDVQSDGKLVVAYQPSASERAGRVLVFEPDGASRVLPLSAVVPGAGAGIRLGGDRIAVVRPTGQSSSELVVSDLSGHSTTMARFDGVAYRPVGFDYDGTRLVWASDHITGTRVDCGPPGIGRPCVKLESGVTTVWLAQRAGTKPSPIARVPFTDQPAGLHGFR
jgi:hypothetical protein